MAASPRHACLPAPALGLLAERACSADDRGYGALREAGRITGERLYDTLDPAPHRLARSEFWSRADERLDALGLGGLAPEALRPGLAAVTWLRGAETVGRRGKAPGCPLAAGILEGLLSAAAGAPVGVLEVDCAVAGAAACRFLVGEPSRLRRLRRELEPPQAPPEEAAAARAEDRPAGPEEDRSAPVPGGGERSPHPEAAEAF